MPEFEKALVCGMQICPLGYCKPSCYLYGSRIISKSQDLCTSKHEFLITVILITGDNCIFKVGKVPGVQEF